jgi:hypothetical protein
VRVASIAPIPRPEAARVNAAPYRFAALAAGMGVGFGAALFGVDRASTAMALAGRPALPKTPPPDFRKLVDARDRVLVTGDSVIRFVPPAERHEPSVFDLLARETSVPLVDASWPARAVDMYAAQITALDRFDIRPRAVVLEINLRHFSPAWEGRPNLQEPYLAPMLESGWFLPLRAAAVFKYDFGARTVAEFLATPIPVGDGRSGTVADVRPRPWFPAEDAAHPELGRVRGVATCAFDFAASPSVPRLRRLLATVARRQIPCVAFVTPLDVGLLENELHADEMAVVRANLAALRKEIGQPGITVVDLATALPTSAFDHVVAGPDEHLVLEGRRVVAARVGEALRAVVGN